MDKETKKELQEINYRIAMLGRTYSKKLAELTDIDNDIKVLLKRRSELTTESSKEVL